MAVQTVFSSNLDPSAPNLSTRFVDATAFYIAAPLINAEVEIDCYLQVYFPAEIGEQVRVIPLGKISEGSILLNISDTETASVIGVEFANTKLEMALLFLASSETFLQAAVVKPDCTICQLETQIKNLDTKLNLVLGSLNIPQPVVSATATASSTNQLRILGII